MRLVSQCLLRPLSRGGGGLSRLSPQPHGVLGLTVTTALPPPHGLFTAYNITTRPSLLSQPPLRPPCNTSAMSWTTYLTEASSSPCPQRDPNTLLIRRSIRPSIGPTRLTQRLPSDPPVDSIHEKGASHFTRSLSRKIIWVVGFFAGMVIGAGFRLSLGFSVKPGAKTNVITLPNDEEECERGSFVPAVMASKGFFSNSNDDDDPNNNSSEEGGKKSGPPKHRANFNFIADVVERLAPSVVFIEILDLRRTDSSGHHIAINNGSGFVVDPSGYVLTNAHVVTNRPRASRVMVRLHDGREMAGTLEEVDPYSDLALIKINASGLVPAPMGNSSDIRPGEFVVAVGAPLSLSNTVTAGVVSSVSRCARDLGIRTNDINYIQTDAAITFGNSGGPLANLDGDVIGINSMKATAGISFAIPVDTAKEFLAKAAAKRSTLLKKRDSSPGSTPGRRAYLGITMLSLTKDIISELQSRAASPLPPDLVHGVLVWRVVIGSPAYHAGLQPGDVITQVNGHVIQAAADVYRLLEKPSDLTMVVLRGNNRYSVTVTPEE